MKQEEFKGYWNQLKGKVKEKWGKLTDDEIMEMKGNRDQLVGSIQKKYGQSKEKVEAELAKLEHEYHK